MKPWFEELDYRRTPMGELVLQRRRIAEMGDAEAYEVKLNSEYLMSSLFHEAEVALADLALARLPGSDWEVVVGGLGLGYTAAATLAFKQTKRLVVVEALEPVIDWHCKGLVPNGPLLSDDPRCVYHHADFFALARGSGFDPATPDYRFDAVLLDIDHTPKHLLAVGHTDFYTEAGVRRLARFIKPNGVFGLWSNEPPDDAFLAILTRVFGRAEGHVVAFDNPLQNKPASNGIYVAGGALSHGAV
ncbi:MAG: spermidine synthase [Kiritimatiellia bacterium]